MVCGRSSAREPRGAWPLCPAQRSNRTAAVGRRVDRLVSVDAGIWLAFLRNDVSAGPLRGLLEDDRVSVHPFVLIELRLKMRGPQRAQIVGDLERLVACAVDP